MFTKMNRLDCWCCLRIYMYISFTCIFGWLSGIQSSKILLNGSLSGYIVALIRALHIFSSLSWVIIEIPLNVISISLCSESFRRFRMLQNSEILLCGLSFGVRMPFQCCSAYGCFVALFRKLLCFKDQERRRRPQPCRNDRDSCNEQPVFNPNAQGRSMWFPARNRMRLYFVQGLLRRHWCT